MCYEKCVEIQRKQTVVLILDPVKFFKEGFALCEIDKGADGESHVSKTSDTDTF